MESNTPQGTNPAVTHNALIITLGAPSIDPGHINPDFLRYNGVVNPDWQVDTPVVIESGFSLVRYTNGLAISASDDYIRVSHTGDSLVMGEIVTADIVGRYLGVAPWPVEYNSIMTDWRGTVSCGSNGLAHEISPLYALGQGVKFGDIAPRMQARAFYRESPDKSIIFYLAESLEEKVITEIRFSAHIHRDMDDVPSEKREEYIRSVLEKWEEDIGDMEELANQFYRTYAPKED